MGTYQETLNKIIENAAGSRAVPVTRVLMIYEEKITLIGDFCVRFNKLGAFRAFLNDAAIDLVFSDKGSEKIYDSLLKNNPHLAGIYSLAWDEIDFGDYGTVFYIGHDEEKFLRFLHERYGPAIESGQYKPAVFSLSGVMLAPARQSNTVFPVNDELVEYVRSSRSGELYLSTEERQWGDQWLRSNGMQPNEDLFILLDSSSRRDKLLTIDVYFDLLTFILNRKDVRVLIFDENQLGKEDFYSAWLGPEKTRKIIFAKGLDLRKALCIMGSEATKMIFGPCTGLMHCASSIYNNYVNNGMAPWEAPLLITYTGQYFEGEKNAHSWWGSSPLVSCLLVKKNNGGKELVELQQLTEEQKEADDSLPCKEYTAAMLTGFIEGRLQPRVSAFVAGA